MSEWVEWAGGSRPVDGYETVDIRFRDGTEFKNERASYWEWAHEFSEDNIIAYRIVKEKEE